MKSVRALVAAATVAVASFAAAAPAQAWECQRSELCHETVMTVCMTIGHIRGEYNCH